MSGFRDGGPAFPVAEDHRIDVDIPRFSGMSLRDYFAGQALLGLLAAGHTPKINNREMSHDEAAYLIADGMLARRRREQA